MHLETSLRILLAVVGCAGYGPGTEGAAQAVDTVQISGRVLFGEHGPEAGTEGPRHSVGIVGGRHTFLDSRGRFELRAAVGDSAALWVQCGVTRRPYGRFFGPFVVSKEEMSRVRLALDPDACVEPEERLERGVYRGHYTVGFETSSFRPCEPLPDLSATAYGLEDYEAWLEFVEGVARTGWPDVPAVFRGYTYYLRVRGTLRGPGGYGHMAVAPYLLLVDSVLDVRPPEDGDCDSGGAPR